MGLAKMSMDETDHQASRDIVTYMSQLAEDKISHPWSAVLDWSNNMVDMVGEGRIHWSDKLERRNLPMSANSVMGYLILGGMVLVPHVQIIVVWCKQGYMVLVSRGAYQPDAV